MGNIHYTPQDKEFWEFNWDQMGAFDLPASFDLALNLSGQKSLSYIGHSQGCAQAYALFTTDAETSSKVDLFVALAPVTYIGNSPSLLLNAMADLHIDALIQLLGIEDFLPSTAVIELLLPKTCHMQPDLCKNIYCLIAGCDWSYVNETRLPVYFSHLPAGTSTQDMIHWAQEIRSKEYQHFDYGSAAANQNAYGQPTPPLYNLSNLMVPTAVFHGGKDTLADPTDVAHMLSLIPQDMLAYHEFLPEFGHGDFVWGTIANTEVYAKVIALIKQYMNIDS
eukprot:GEZU01024337.1.p1 GENE.GEZU01024337.1~~GEZU01024337.1.p1  ORF type:complete len:279 (+),score=67.86 GEZU01024337.1:98-934(+)